MLVGLAGISMLVSKPNRAEVLILCHLIALLALVSSQTGISFYRYAIPALAFTAVLVGRLACARVAPWLQQLGQLAICVHIVVSACNFPTSLGFFSCIAGHGDDAFLSVSGTSDDWGQDLYLLSRRLHGVDMSETFLLCVSPMHLGHFGISYGDGYQQAQPATLILSASFLRGEKSLLPPDAPDYFDCDEIDLSKYQIIRQIGGSIYILNRSSD